MHKQILLGASIALLSLVACDKEPGQYASDRSPAAPAPNADNTARNEADQSGVTKTPIDQSEKQSDITITADIRREIMKADGMSINGQNVKVITDAGVVTLRGPVDTVAEKERIETLAKAVAGVVRVDNQLEVKTNP
jgi:hyperosmotically inducible periplasmic protein